MKQLFYDLTKRLAHGSVARRPLRETIILSVCALFLVVLAIVCGVGYISEVGSDAAVREIFDDIMFCVALSFFGLGYAVGAAATFWLPRALWKSFDYYVGDVWPFIAFFVHPLPALATAFLFSRPFDAWLY